MRTICWPMILASLLCLIFQSNVLGQPEAEWELKPLAGQAEFGFIEIRGVAARSFNSEMWQSGTPLFVPDLRAPMLEPEWTGEWRNIYAPSIVQTGATWRLFYGAWDGVDSPNDRIYSRDTADWLRFTPSRVEIEHGVFVHVCNVFATLGRAGGFNMICTAYPDADGLNKPAWISRNGSDSEPPHEAQYADLVPVNGYEGWSKADVNGVNVLFDTGDRYRMYFNDWKNPGKVYYAESQDGRAYDLTGTALETPNAVNDVKKFSDGEAYLMLLHRNTDRVWHAYSRDGLTFQPPRELFERQGDGDRYIVAGGWVTDGGNLLGVIYGAGAVPELNRNRIFARWLQRRVVFTDDGGKEHFPEAAIGPDRQLIRIDGDVAVKGTLHLLEPDGVTRVGGPIRVEVKAGQIYELNAPKSAAGSAGLSGFRDGSKHFKDQNPDDQASQYEPEEVTKIADNILLHQHSNGGWKSNWDPQRILTQEEVESLIKERDALDTTFDNRATYPQIEYLASAYNSTQDPRYREAALRGLEFMLEAQHPSGGFPHSYPSTANYRPKITFMDEVTIGALRTLRKAGEGSASFTFLDETLRERCRSAAERGIACVLKLQQRHNGALTVWAGQYDPETLEPTGARSFELPSLVCAESVGVVQFLMELEDPSAEINAAIAGALDWFRASRIEGYRIETFEIEPVRYEHHTATTDRRMVVDPDAPPLWARFYEFDSMKPILVNRDGIKVETYAEVHPERRSGYAWYGDWPARLLESQGSH